MSQAVPRHEVGFIAVETQLRQLRQLADSTQASSCVQHEPFAQVVHAVSLAVAAQASKVP